MTLRTVTVNRYVTPLREGGSLPAVVEADDDGMYVLKFRGAGQGRKALIAELVGGQVGRAAGLLVPEIVLAQLDAELARTEPDPEIQDLIRASDGLNLALDFLPGAITFDPLAHAPAPRLASRIVWLDAFLSNVDRTARNSNMMVWHGKLWLIDHGASLYFHHQWEGYLERSSSAFPMVRDHVLLPFASELAEADAEMTACLTEDVMAGIVETIPVEWLEDDPHFPDKQGVREAYRRYLVQRLRGPRHFVEEAQRAHAALV